MLWTRPLVMLRLLALLLTSELVRSGFFVSALPVAGPGLGLGTAVIGAMVGVHYLADALAKGPVGLVTERWGLGRVLALGSGLGFLVVLGTRLAPSPVWGVLGCALWGVTYAALWPGLMSTSQALARPGYAARALAVSSLSVAPAILGGVLGVGPLLQARPETGWTLLLGAQGAALLLALSLLRLHLSPLPGVSAPAGNIWQGWARVAVLLPAAFAQTLAPGLLVTLFYPLLARLGLGLGDLLGPGLLALVAFGACLWGAGRLADRTHPRRVLTPGLLLLALTFGVAALPGLEARLWLLAPLLGLGYGAFIAGWNGLVGRVLPAGHRAAAWGTVMAVEALGYAAGPLLGGLAWARFGQAGVFTLGAAVFLLTEAYYLWPGRAVSRAAPHPE
ncbi:major facilitator superfamily transporter [Deinococcus phoenicis]|uniref:Major facilitator superfamily transporter n=1 Tax=Deinococcus phoenicis TaxID=1476583 RepID=A0A016QSE3_9DEIO|nr:MFS transporter [Deinococcus phoenicis]EYB68978.1 major facilitator superfamily transporter [Deinococcus phoenicis]